MRRLYIFWGLALLLWCVSGQAQKIIYVSSVKGQDYGAGTFTNPYQTIAKALTEVNGETEIRVTEGKYHLVKELIIPAGVILRGGYRLDGELRWGDAAEKTILIGTGKTRVVKLAGILDGVTVKGGFAQGQNGGGVYVSSGGKVINCIITENKASYRFPKVGDLLMKDKSYLDVAEFTYDMYDKVLGVICWVNTDQGADPGEQGLAVSTDFTMGNWAINPSNVSIPNGITMAIDEEAAMMDLNGKAHTGSLSTVSIGAQWNRNKGAEWIYPSLGMLGIVATEWHQLELTFNTLYDEMHSHYSGDILKSFFGEKIQIAVDYKDSHHYMRQQTAWTSSTLKDRTNYWRMATVMGGDCKVESAKVNRRATVIAFGIIKF